MKTTEKTKTETKNATAAPRPGIGPKTPDGNYTFQNAEGTAERSGVILDQKLWLAAVQSCDFHKTADAVMCAAHDGEPILTRKSGMVFMRAKYLAKVIPESAPAIAALCKTLGVAPA